MIDLPQMMFPWMGISILIPLVGAAWVDRVRDPDRARLWCLLFCGLAFAATCGAWINFAQLGEPAATDRGQLMSLVLGREVLVLDQFSAPLLFLVAVLHMLTVAATLRTKIRRFSFAWTLVAEAIMLATFSCREPWGVIGLLAAGTVPPYLELRGRLKPTRVYRLHMALFVALLIIGQACLESESVPDAHSVGAIGALMVAVFIRAGVVPFHGWMTDLFENASFGTSLLFVAPLTGAYAAVRLVLPIAPDWVLHGIGLFSLITSVYAASMSLVQREGRRFFCYLFISNSALVLGGLEMVTEIGLTGALCVWLSLGLSLGGFGLTLRALERRVGRLQLNDYQGLYEHTPNLAMCFALTGLTSVGFPGTFGFVGTELLVDGAVEAYPYVGIAVVAAAALNGIAVVKTYFRLFTGRLYPSSMPLMIRMRERYSVLALAALILVGGTIPQPWVQSRYEAAAAILSARAKAKLSTQTEEE